MRLVGKTDENFGEMADNAGKVIVALDYNSVVPLLSRKPSDAFSVCEESFESLLTLLSKELGDAGEKDALLLMRVPVGTSAEDVKTYGWKINELFGEDSLVVWAAQEYDRFRFDVYLYQ